MDTARKAHAYVSAFVDELVRSGVRHVCFSPGSRSTPLIMLMAERPELTTWLHIDERSAGFFALGLAKELGEPVALVCSSGTAAANFYPAVIEAFYDRVPLLVLTADRPHELRDSGAPQTINQIRLYGEHVKWFMDVPLPECSVSVLRFIRSVAARAAAEARRAPAGPVHLNFPFREPLVPEPGPVDEDAARAGGKPYFAVAAGDPSLSDEETAALVDELRSWRRGLIVCGPQRDPRLAEYVAPLADALGYPILADPLSGVRYGWHDSTWIIDAYDALLRDETFVDAHEPEIVLRFGAAPTSKALKQYFQRHARARHIAFDEGGGWRDPLHLTQQWVHASPRHVCQALIATLPGDLVYADRSWAEKWRTANRVAKRAASEAVEQFDELFEGRIFMELGRILPRRAVLYVGNSMPVRDLDSFLFHRPEPLRCYANRGANGIDGVVSSALGASAASKHPVVLVIGDLSFYHDLNGLLAAKMHGIDLTVILVHNDGGGIFSFLPQAAHAERFEALFGTPHGLDFAPAAAMYGGSYVRIKNWEQFRRAVETGISRGGLNIVEVPTARHTNAALHGAVWQAVRRALRDGVEVYHE